MNAIAWGISVVRPLWNPVRNDTQEGKWEPMPPPYPSDLWSCWSVGDELTEHDDCRVMWIEVASLK